ncbi:hypothetical protein COHA_002770 [Chlorella ohadii]|uniref:Reverse transcriptase domain-containing protein n=1 Tax=Chlorella ohadii TaxID=2649997 RepID=A0AAD5H797_9CHLO|nr:hypothetical protein COHA_002770 [Chlorella ohadii]
MLLPCLALLAMAQPRMLNSIADLRSSGRIFTPPPFLLPCRATIVYVGSDETGENGNVHALVDRGSDGTAGGIRGQQLADEVCPLLTGQDTPNGTAWHNGSLLVMETTRLTRYDNIDAAVLNGCNINLAKGTVLLDTFPQQQDHAARYIAVGPDGWLYIGVGAPLNIVQCGVTQGGVQQCSIMRVRLDGTGLQTFAYGVRNTVGFDWDPRTGILYFGFLERDWQGASNSTSTGYSADSNNQPDDYLYAAPAAGLHYGYPWCHWVGAGKPELRDLGPGYAVADSTLVPPAAEPLAAADGGPTSAQYKLWAVLSQLGYSGPWLRAVQAIYGDVPMSIRAPWLESRVFQATLGVKQGCPLSPTLFSLYIADFERRVLAAAAAAGGTPLDLPVLAGRLVPPLFYADDCALLATSAQGLQAQLRLLEAFRAERGLTVNLAKTKVALLAGADSEEDALQRVQSARLTYGGGMLEAAPEFKYLGVLQRALEAAGVPFDPQQREQLRPDAVQQAAMQHYLQRVAEAAERPGASRLRHYFCSVRPSSLSTDGYCLPSYISQHLVHWIDAPRRSWRLSAVLCIWFCLTTVLPYSGEASSWELIKALLRGDVSAIAAWARGLPGLGMLVNQLQFLTIHALVYLSLALLWVGGWWGGIMTLCGQRRGEAVQGLKGLIVLDVPATYGAVSMALRLGLNVFGPLSILLSAMGTIGAFTLQASMAHKVM